MLIPAFISIALLVLALTLLASAGFMRAHRQGVALIREHIVEATQSTTIDLRPQVYAELPAPVRRYFDFAFNGRSEVLVHWVDWTEQGQFLLPIGRFDVRGRQVNRANEPVYAWTGIFRRFGLPLLESRDSFFLDSHDMRARLLGWLKVMHTDYEDEEQLASLYSYLVLRYYGQAPLMPWALLPNEHVQWLENDDSSAWLQLTREGLKGRYLVSFGSDGRIERMEIDRLLMEGNEIKQREVGQKLDYRELNGFQVPGKMDYRWYLEDGTLSSHYTFEVSQIRIVE